MKRTETNPPARLSFRELGEAAAIQLYGQADNPRHKQGAKAARIYRAFEEAELNAPRGRAARKAVKKIEKLILGYIKDQEKLLNSFYANFDHVQRTEPDAARQFAAGYVSFLSGYDYGEKDAGRLLPPKILGASRVRNSQIKGN